MYDDKLTWQHFYQDGKAYHKTSVGAASRPRIFTPDIMLNLIGMAIEKYLMAVFLRRGTLPDNHTMFDLIAALKPEELAEPVKQTMLEMDNMQQICLVDHIEIRHPEPEDITRFLQALDSVAKFAGGELEVCVT